MKGHIRQRGKDTWAIVIYLGTEQGKKRQKWYTVHGSKRDAERELRRLLHEMDTGAYAEPSKLTVGEYLERWLNEYAAVRVAPLTLRRYQTVVRDHLIPLLGAIPLAKLTPMQIQRAYRETLESGNKRIPGPMAPQSVATHHRVFRKALAQAVKWQLLSRNPSDGVEPPRFERREMMALDEAGVLRLLERVRESKYFLPILLAVNTGMRRGEILALRWQDVDLDAGNVMVRRTAQQLKGRVEFKEPKTAKSRRLVRLPADVVAALRKHKVKQAEDRLFLGAQYHDNGLVFTQMDGKPVWPSHVSDAFRYLAHSMGLRMRFHDLRHTHATLLLKAGVNPKVVSERLGHSTVGITLDVYSHVLPDMQDEAVRRFEVNMEAARKKRVK